MLTAARRASLPVRPSGGEQVMSCSSGKVLGPGEEARPAAWSSRVMGGGLYSLNPEGASGSTK